MVDKFGPLSNLIKEGVLSATAIILALPSASVAQEIGEASFMANCAAARLCESSAGKISQDKACDGGVCEFFHADQFAPTENNEFYV